MRAVPLFPVADIPYSNVLHGHSHLAILGWAFLGVFTIFLALFWSGIQAKKQAGLIVVSLAIVSGIMFLAFLYQGYGIFSIVMSTLHIFIEYWAAVFMFREIRRHDVPKVFRAFINGALFSLLLSSIGPFSLGYISANGLKESGFFDMAIYFYLHFQYNGWLTLMSFGLFTYLLHRQKIFVNDSLLRKGFRIYFTALFPGYFLSVMWVDGVGGYGDVLAVIGGIGQWMGVILMILSLKGAWSSIKNKWTKVTFISAAVTIGLLLIKSTLELGMIFPPLAELVYQTRSVIIGYLHLTLLGFVSLFIVTLHFMLNLMEANRLKCIGLWIFLAGFLLNEGLLFLQSLFEWLEYGVLPLYNEGLLTASVLLFIGILGLSPHALKR